MNKKTTVKLELEESVKNVKPSSNRCPVCLEYFCCALSRESHMKLYPKHFEVGTSA